MTKDTLKASNWERSESCIFVWKTTRNEYDLEIKTEDGLNYKWEVRLFPYTSRTDLGGPYIIIDSDVAKSWDDAKTEIVKVLDKQSVVY